MELRPNVGRPPCEQASMLQLDFLTRLATYVPALTAEWASSPSGLALSRCAGVRRPPSAVHCPLFRCPLGPDAIRRGFRGEAVERPWRPWRPLETASGSVNTTRQLAVAAHQPGMASCHVGRSQEQPWIELGKSS